MRNNFIYHLLGTALFLFHLSATAEDIDLFVGAPPTTPDPANILFVLDNTANWSRNNSDGDAIFVSEKSVLVDTFTNLPTNADGTAKFNIGIMLGTESGSGNSGNDGGYIRAAIRAMNTTNKALYATMLDTLDQNKDKGSSGTSGLQMAEAYRYFDAGAPYAGNGKVKADYTGNSAASWNNSYSTAAMKTAMSAIYALSGNAKSGDAASNYTSPITPGSCSKNYVVYISNGANQQNNSADTMTNSMLAAAGGSTTEIPISPTGSQGNPSDEWAKFMKSSAHEITTYSIDVDKVTNGQGPGWTALLRSMAGVSGGKYFDVSSASGGAELSDALNTILSEILSVNSVFASVSLPVSVNTQGTYLNQVFVGLFRPDANAFPRWDGNLKQYKLGILDNKLKLLDADNAAAINNQTGFLTECARSYWTPNTTDSYWVFKPQGNCLTVANSTDSNYPDGNIVEKGAAAYELRSDVSRTVKTCDTTFADCTSLVAYSTSVVTQAALGAADATEHTWLFLWQYGYDMDDENINGVLAEMRPSIHGDVVHSRPVAINYGTNADPEVVVYYGANDGMLHAINGNRSDAFSSVDAGDEFWAFIPPEFFSQIKRLRDNDTQINYLGNATVSPAPLPKPYGMDGSVTGYKDGSDYYIYAAMRRGGRVLYAFDVTTPTNPILKWKKGCPNNFPTSGAVSDADCTTGFSGMGQTWSSPQVFTASGYSGGSSPLLIMGGGYDTCEDYDALSAGGANHSCSSGIKGNKVYILNADTGALLKTFNTDRSVVGDVFVVREFNEGSNSWEPAQYAYVADMGGNLYRISGVDANTPFASTAPGSWTITKIASLGCSGISTCTANRKFMFSPDVVKDGSSYFILIGSGDREKPLSGYAAASAVANRFYMIEDQPTNATWLSSENATCGSDILCNSSLVAITTASDPTDAALAAKKGWYLALQSTEQVVTSGITVFDTLTFSTHAPAVAMAGSCTSNLGSARVYNISYKNASSANGTNSRYQDITGGGLPPSPIAGMVTLDDGNTVPFLIGGDPDSPIEGGEPTVTSAGTQSKGRVYWYIKR